MGGEAYICTVRRDGCEAFGHRKAPAPTRPRQLSLLYQPTPLQRFAPAQVADVASQWLPGLVANFNTADVPPVPRYAIHGAGSD